MNSNPSPKKKRKPRASKHRRNRQNRRIKKERSQALNIQNSENSAPNASSASNSQPLNILNLNSLAENENSTYNFNFEQGSTPSTPLSPSEPDQIKSTSSRSDPIPLENSRPPFPSYSTSSSMEFIEGLPIDSPSHSAHFKNPSFLNFVSQFPQSYGPISPETYTIGPYEFNLDELKNVISKAAPECIPVYLPGISVPYLVPVQFFHRIFPSNSATLEEISDESQE